MINRNNKMTGQQMLFNGFNGEYITMFDHHVDCAKYGAGVAQVIPYRMLDGIAWLYIGANYVDKGIELARLNIVNHPTLSSAYGSLAEIYETVPNLDKALAGYRQAHKIASNNNRDKKVGLLM